MSAKIIFRLNKLHQMIVEKRTGTPNEISKKIKVSSRQVRNYISTLKEMGGQIEFCRKTKSYYYKKESQSLTFDHLENNIK